jgi:ABC-type dipeptide/oligopeptide/nickel transport system permease component
MREAIRRLLWLAPTLVVVTVLAFWAISRALLLDGPEALPLFFNTAPVGVRELAWQAATDVAQGGPQTERAERTLSELGGAALPHVLPRMDSLTPEGRQRVARALAPLAVRMDTAVERSLRQRDTAVEFWSRFWADNFVDFNPAIVKRVVTRYAQRPSALRERELKRLDAFALDELLRQMDELRTPGQFAQLRRLTEAAAHVTGNPWVLPLDADTSVAREINARWQSWWAPRRRDYVSLQGVERLLSPLLHTRYATWVQESVRSEFGVLRDGKPALAALREQAPITLYLLLVGLLGGTLLGISSGALAALLKPRVARALESGLAILLLCVPLGALFITGVPESAAGKRALATFSMLLFGALLVSRYQRTSSQQLLQHTWIRCQRAMGASPARLALYTLRPSSNLAISAMAPHTSTLLTTVFVVEFALGIDGIGPTTIAALGDREVEWVMMVTVATAALVGLIQVLSDIVLARLDPRRLRSDNEVDNG